MPGWVKALSAQPRSRWETSGEKWATSCMVQFDLCIYLLCVYKLVVGAWFGIGSTIWRLLRRYSVKSSLGCPPLSTPTRHNTTHTKAVKISLGHQRYDPRFQYANDVPWVELECCGLGERVEPLFSAATILPHVVKI